MAAEAAISSAVELLGNLLIQKVKSLRGVEGKVQSLKEELDLMKSFLKVANKKQAEDEGVREWIKKIREVAHDAEDTIEMFVINVENAKKRNPLKRCTSFPKRMYHLNRIGDEIESIRARLDAIDKSRARYGIKISQESEAAESTSTGISQVELQRRLSPRQNDEEMVGIEDDVKKLLQESILDVEKKGLSTAVIKGMGGIGKSTLAREIYNHPDVRGRFECCAWVVVSSEFRERETMKQLIFELTSPDNKDVRALEKSNKDEHYLLRKLEDMLRQLLQGKSYLIVLDDVWEKQHWEYLRRVFPNEEDKISRVLLTTRNQKILTVNDHYEHEMKSLDFEKSWKLLLKKASINGKCPDDLERIGKHIVKKCCGLPLAISVVGGLLMGTRTQREWTQVLNQIKSYLGGKKSNVSSILELSYQNLPTHLKPCFSSLAIFKEDKIIPAERLVDIWVAQGLIQKEGSGTIDEIGRVYMDELINRSMLQIHDLTVDDQVKYCRLHDLLRDMCLSKAEEEMGLYIVSAAPEDEPSCKYRHCVVYTKENMRTFLPKRNKHLRSLFLLDVSNVRVRIPSNYWKSFQLLKTLDIDGFELLSLPRSFRLLVGLNSLRIRCKSGTRLPGWLDQLKKLEVLDAGLVWFPDVPLKMKSLRHLRAILIGISRRMSIENWTNIETIKGITPRNFLRIIPTILASSHLRELGMHIHNEKGADAVRRAIASLEKMTDLVKLKLVCDPDHFSVSALKLDGSAFPPNLSHLSLQVRVDENPMEELGKLPNLVYLELWNYYGEENGIDWRMKVSHDGFPCLEALLLHNMKDLRGMDIEEGGMPCLKRLRISDCPNLHTQNLPERIIVSSSHACYYL